MRRGRHTSGMDAPTSIRGRIGLWALSLLLAFVFLSVGASKVLGTERSKEDFARWGYPDWFRPVVGSGEILASLLLLVPNVRVFGGSLRFWGALGLTGNMTGAVFTHLRVEEFAVVPLPLVLLALAATVAWFTRPAYLRAKAGASVSLSTAR